MAIQIKLMLHLLCLNMLTILILMYEDMANYILLFFLWLFATVSTFGQGSETFSNLPTNNSGTYYNFSFAGNNGLTWTAQQGRNDQTLTGKAFCGRGQSPGSTITSGQISNGIGTLEFDYKRGFTSENSRSIKVLVNGVQIGVTIAVNKSSNTPVHYSQPINIAGNVVISIQFGGEQSIIDNIQWTAFSATPEVNLLGNSNNIISGSTTTSIANHTDFGTAEVGVGSQLQTFIIENIGNVNLTLTDPAPYITIIGVNAADFALISPPSSPVVAAAQTPFQITFSPTALGIRKAIVSIATNDSDENPYTFAISGTGTYSNQSQIVDFTNYQSVAPEFNNNVEYSNFTDPSSTSVGKFIPMKLRILDGPDSDVLPTTLTDLRISVTDLAAANQLSMVKTAILTTSGGTVISTATKVAGELVFSGMSGSNVTALDEGQQNIHLRISIDETKVIDQTKLIFLITAATASSSGSSFGMPNAGGAQTDSANSNTKNLLNVRATKLIFITQPQTTPVNLTMTEVVLEAADGNNRTDLDYAMPVSLTSTGTMSGSPIIENFTDGLATFSSIVHTVAGVGLKLNATSASLSAQLSNAFNITEIIYQSGDYRTSGSGMWVSNNAAPAIWERFDGSSWVPSNSPALSTTNNVFIRSSHTITTGTTFNGVKLKIMAGGTFLVQSFGSITSSIYIYGGGKLRMDLELQNNGLFEVENDGIVEINFPVAYNSKIWFGTEKFHPKSNLVLLEFFPPTPFFNGLTVTQNLFNGYSAAFGNVIIDVLPTASTTLFNPGLTANLAHGDLVFRNFPVSESFRFCNGGTTSSEIGGNFIVEDGYSSKINSCTSGELNFTIKGNMIIGSGDTRILESSPGVSTFNIEGNLTLLNDAMLQLMTTTASNAYATINLKGNLTCPSTATIRSANASPNYIINFTGSTVQTIDVATTLATSNSNIIYNVGFGSKVQLKSQDLKLGTNGVFNVLDGGTLDFGFNNTTALNISRATSVTGTKFSSEAGSTLKITSPDGIVSTSGTVGNVQTTNAPSYNGLATFWYQGKQNQVTGSGLSTASSGKLVYVNMDQDNLSLTLTANVNITNSTALDPLGGKLEILKGTLIGSNTADFHGTGRLKMSGGEYKISSYFTSNPETTYLPRLQNYGNYVLSGGVINLAADNQTQIISGTPNYFGLKFSGSNTLGVNYKGISTATAVANSIVISENSILDVKSSSFGVLPQQPTFTMTDNSRFITAGTGVKPDMTGTYTLGQNSTIEFSNSTAITMQRPRLTNPVPSYSNIVVSGSNVGNISLGGGANSNLSFQPFGSFRVTSTGTYKLFNSFGFSGSAITAIKNTNSPTIHLENGSTIEYAGANQTISLLNQNTNPLTQYYSNLTISGSGQKTLGHPSDIFINENLRINSANLFVNSAEVITVGEAVISISGTMQIENNGQLIQINDLASNSGTGLTYKRIALAKHLDYIYWSSPVDNFTTLNLPGNNHYQWNTLFPNLNETQGNWEAPSTVMTKGRGYIARASNDAAVPEALTADFVGKPNNGVVTIPIFRGVYDGPPYDAEPSNPNNLNTTKDDDNWNLLGNPYPSAISAEYFLEQNTLLIAGAVHIWTHASLPTSATDFYYGDFAYNYYASDYSIYNKLGSSIPNTFNGKIAAGQGFMVTMLDAAALGSSVVFNNAMRYQAAFAPYDNTNFYKNQSSINNEDKSRIWLDLVNITTAEVGTILVGYAEEATMEKDHFYDCSFESRGDHSLYSLIDSESFVIQGRSLPFNIDDIVPLGFSVNKLGDLAISIRDVDGIFDTDIPIFLEDKDLDVFHDLKNSPYFFNSEIGTFDHRFQLRYGAKLSTEDFGNVSSAIQIIGRDGIVYLKSKENLIDEVSIYDVLGRLLYKSSNGNTFYLEIPLNILARQAIIVKAKMANGHVVSQKIIF